MIRNISITIIIIFLNQCAVFAQSDSICHESNSNKLTTKFYFANKFNAILYGSHANEITMESNNPLGIGFGISWRKIGFGFSYGIGFIQNQNKGYTKSFDIQVNRYGKKFLFDVIAQHYQGFYDDNNGEYRIFDDIETFKIGIFGQYIFNSGKYSYNFLFDQKEQQYHSAGTWLLGGGVFYNQIDFGTQLVSNYDTQKNILMGPSLGYAYTWVMRRDFYLALSLSIGANLGFSPDEREFIIAPATTPRFAFGYTGESWGLSISYVNHLIYTLITEENKIGTSTGNLKFTFIKRF